MNAVTSIFLFHIQSVLADTRWSTLDIRELKGAPSHGAFVCDETLHRYRVEHYISEGEEPSITQGGQSSASLYYKGYLGQAPAPLPRPPVRISSELSRNPDFQDEDYLGQAPESPPPPPSARLPPRSPNFQDEVSPTFEFGRQMPPARWQWISAVDGNILPLSFVGGRNLRGRAVYVARAVLTGGNVGQIPGGLNDGDICARVNFKGRDVCRMQYQLLRGNFYIWVLTKANTKYHPDIVEAGFENVFDNKLYVCKVDMYHNGQRFDAIGKASKSGCWVSAEVASQGVKSFEKSFSVYYTLVGAAD